jgi:hypothetical protein
MVKVDAQRATSERPQGSIVCRVGLVNTSAYTGASRAKQKYLLNTSQKLRVTRIISATPNLEVQVCN